MYDDIFNFYNSELFEHLVRLTLFFLMFSLGLDFSLHRFADHARSIGYRFGTASVGAF